MWETVKGLASTSGAAVISFMAPLLKPLGDLIGKLADKSYIFIIAWMAKRQGKKDARADSVEETLKNVDKVKKLRNNKELREHVSDKYTRK